MTVSAVPGALATPQLIDTPSDVAHAISPKSTEVPPAFCCWLNTMMLWLLVIIKPNGIPVNVMLAVCDPPLHATDALTSPRSCVMFAFLLPATVGNDPDSGLLFAADRLVATAAVVVAFVPPFVTCSIPATELLFPMSNSVDRAFEPLEDGNAMGKPTVYPPTPTEGGCPRPPFP